MRKHDGDGGMTFDTPDDWTDRTIVAFAAPVRPGGQHAPNIVVTEEPMSETETVQTHAGRQLAQLAKQMPEFDLVESYETTLAGLPAIYFRFHWVSHFGAIEQAMTIVARDVAAGRLVVTFASTVRVEEAEQMRPTFSDILRSVQFGTPEVRSVSDVAPCPPQTESLDLPHVPMPGARRARG
jgi:hypothetical protein